MSASAAVQACELCGGEAFTRAEEGFYVCRTCGVQSQDFVPQEGELTSMLINARRQHVRAKGKKRKRTSTTRTPNVYNAYLEAFLSILYRQTDELVQLGLPDALRNTVGNMALRYLQFCESSAQDAHRKWLEDAQPRRRLRRRKRARRSTGQNDLGRSTTSGAGGSSAAAATASTVATQILADDDEEDDDELEALDFDGPTQLSQFGTLPTIPEYEQTPVPTLMLSEDDDDDDDEEEQDDEGEEENNREHGFSSTELAGDDMAREGEMFRYPPLGRTIALLYAAIRWLRCPFLLADLIEAVEQERVTWIRALTELPSSIRDQLSSFLITRLSPLLNTSPSCESIVAALPDICRALNLSSLPPPNMRLCLARIGERLDVPPHFAELAHNLAVLSPFSTVYHSTYYPWEYAFVAAYMAVCIKLLYGINDEMEQTRLNNLHPVIRDGDRVTHYLPRWSDLIWCMSVSPPVDIPWRPTDIRQSTDPSRYHSLCQHLFLPRKSIMRNVQMDRAMTAAASYFGDLSRQGPPLHSPVEIPAPPFEPLYRQIPMEAKSAEEYVRYTSTQYDISGSYHASYELLLSLFRERLRIPERMLHEAMQLLEMCLDEAQARLEDDKEVTYNYYKLRHVKKKWLTRLPPKHVLDKLGPSSNKQATSAASSSAAPADPDS
eukprot:m.59568 g.59568  ORF g.59568 m.59568 type:complete len:664 (+) comp7228_c0_seq1:103-2094(+)